MGVEENSPALTNCYLIVIDEITEVHFKKSSNSMRVYLNICANFYSAEDMTYSGRTLSLNLVELENISSTVYRTN